MIVIMNQNSTPKRCDNHSTFCIHMLGLINSSCGATKVTCKDVSHELLVKMDDMMRKKVQPPLLCSIYEQQFKRNPPKVCKRVSNIDSNLERHV